MWQQILRGPRPPSVQWLRSQSNVNVNGQQRLHPRNRRPWQSEARNVRESRTHDNDAVVKPGEARILGEESPKAQGLIAALKQARDRAVVLRL